MDKNIKLDTSICSNGEIDYPISQYKIDNCFIPNGETYPLCKGQVGNKHCKECNLFEDMVEPYDYV